MRWAEISARAQITFAQPVQVTALDGRAIFPVRTPGAREMIMASRKYRMRAGLSEHDMQRAEGGKCYRAEPSEDKFGQKTDLLDLLEEDGTPVAIFVPRAHVEVCNE
jgi:hypothetical protein